MVEKSLYDYDKHAPPTPPGEEGEWKEGFCTICATDKAPYQCVKCGSNVCTEHFVSIMGLCLDCAPVKDRGKEFKITGSFQKGKVKSWPHNPDEEENIYTVYVNKSTRAKKRKRSEEEEGDVEGDNVRDTGSECAGDGDDNEEGDTEGKEIDIDWV